MVRICGVGRVEKFIQICAIQVVVSHSSSEQQQQQQQKKAVGGLVNRVVFFLKAAQRNLHSQAVILSVAFTRLLQDLTLLQLLLQA